MLKTIHFAAIEVPFLKDGLESFVLPGWVQSLREQMDPVTLFCALLVILLTGMLLHMRRMRMALEKEAVALRKSESHLRTVGDNLADITIFQLIRDNESGMFGFGYIGKGLEHILGINREQFMTDAHLALDFVYEDDLPRLAEAMQSAVAELKPANMEIRVLNVDGIYKWLHISAIPQPIDNTLVWDGFMMDISIRKDAEQTLAEESQNFQNLFETIDDFLLVCDLEGRLQHTNPAIGKRLGYSYSELSGMTIYELYPKDERTAVYRTVAELKSEASVTCDLPLKMRSGTPIPVEMNLFQGTWKNEKALFGVARDVARFQQTENALRESERILQLIIDSIPLSIFWKDQDSVYLGCNKSFIHECHLEHIDNVIGKTPFDLFDEKHALDILERDLDVLNANEALMNHSEAHPLPDGTMGRREVSLIPMRDEAGHAVGVLGVWRDVTEQNKAEERLKRTLEDMERFNQLMRGRERRTLELKDEINDLLLELGRDRKYRTTSKDVA
jgi:PAS domain S-box-containing protein